MQVDEISSGCAHQQRGALFVAAQTGLTTRMGKNTAEGSPAIEAGEVGLGWSPSVRDPQADLPGPASVRARSQPVARQ
jgi:hypothetical protein